MTMAVAPGPDLEERTAEDVLRYVVARFGRRVKVACSFQKEASVIMDMLARIEPETTFFTLDTGFLFPETLDTWRVLEERYGTTVEVHRGISPERQAQLHGDELWRRDPDACCGIRKVAPLREALTGAEAWVSGQRRDQSPTRSATPKLGWDAKHGLWKASPLADWSEREVWTYIARHDVPYHPLHDRGYASIGCTHCTRPAAGREGRWAGRSKTECGLHA